MKIGSWLVAVLLLLMASTAGAVVKCENIANVSPVREMPIEQRAAIVAACEERSVSERATAVQETASVVRDIGPVAKDIATAIGILAKELGIAANDFLDSPAGLLTAGLIAYKVAGEGAMDIIDIIVGLPVLALLTIALIYVIVRVPRTKVQYEMVPALWGAFKYRRVVLVETDTSEDLKAGAVLTAGIIYVILFLGITIAMMV